MKQNSSAVRRTADAVIKFALAPACPKPLGALRALVAIVLLGQAYLLSSQWRELFGADGIMQEALTGHLIAPWMPRVSTITGLISDGLAGAETVLLSVQISYVVALIFLAVGLFTPAAALVSWLLHWVLMNSGYCTNYGADVFAHIFLFYFIWMPVGRSFSLDVMVRKKSSAPSDTARLALRVLQIHLCCVYLAGGIEKAMGPQWWNGEAIWRSLMLPVYAQFDLSWMASVPWLAKLLGWSTLIVEIGYAFLIWPRDTRRVWVAFTIGLHLGIAIFLGLGIFAGLMAVLTLCVFGISAEPREAPVLKTSRRDAPSLPAVCTVS